MVFPAPFGPIRPVTRPFFKTKLEVVHGVDPAERLPQADDLDDRSRFFGLVPHPHCRCRPVISLASELRVETLTAPSLAGAGMNLRMRPIVTPSGRSPCGRSIRTTMSSTPKAISRTSAASSGCISITFSKKGPAPITTVAPSTEPRRLPRPPMTTMATIRIDCSEAVQARRDDPVVEREQNPADCGDGRGEAEHQHLLQPDLLAERLGASWSSRIPRSTRRTATHRPRKERRRPPG